MTLYEPHEHDDPEWNDFDEDELREERAQRRREADERENELSNSERGLV